MTFGMITKPEMVRLVTVDTSTAARNGTGLVSHDRKTKLSCNPWAFRSIGCGVAAAKGSRSNARGRNTISAGGIKPCGEAAHDKAVRAVPHRNHPCPRCQFQILATRGRQEGHNELAQLWRQPAEARHVGSGSDCGGKLLQYKPHGIHLLRFLERSVLSSF